MMEITLRPFTDSDVPMFTRWLGMPHVAPWYSHPADWLTEVAGRNGEFNWIQHFIICAGQQPIGFCQYYPYWRSGEDWQGSLPLTGSYSLDYLIGEPSFLRKGYAGRALRLLCRQVFACPDAARIIVQPEPENYASCKTLLSAGFCYDAPDRLYLLDR